MSTKNTSTSSAQFNPAGMQAYQNLSQMALPQMQQNITNPTGSPFFTSQVKNMQNFNNTSLATGTQSLMQRAQALGISPNSPAYFSQLNQLGRQNMASTGQGMNNLLLGAYGTRQQSLGQAMNYRPLQTGGTQTQTTGGLGSWLPQVLAGGAQMGADFYSQRMTGNAGPNYGGSNGGPDNTAGPGQDYAGTEFAGMQADQAMYNNPYAQDFGSGQGGNWNMNYGPSDPWGMQQ